MKSRIKGIIILSVITTAVSLLGNAPITMGSRYVQCTSGQMTTVWAKESARKKYSPRSVAKKAIKKCQAKGMVTTKDNLKRLLKKGKITKKEYKEYYPYDGLGYYSVFVEDDLHTASTVSGRRLKSENQIAKYIADMMLLETSRIFYIEYAGVTKAGSKRYYEFRCYR